MEIDAAERRRLRTLAAGIRASDRSIDATAPFRPGARQGAGAGAALVIHDMAAVASLYEGRRLPAEHRALLLARAGDAVALWTRRVPEFEGYCRDVLGIGPVELLRPAGARGAASLTDACRRDAGVVRRLAALARRRGGLTVQPYLGTGTAWALAAAIGDAAGATVRVAAPPPTLTSRVNDKLWFAARVTEALGTRALPRTTEAHSPAVLAARVRGLARAHGRVALKLPGTAAGAGNLMLDAAPFRHASLRAVRDRLLAALRRVGWPARPRLLVSVWESPVVMSPSVQLWVPRPAAGAPIVEGIFEQRVEGAAGRFVGAAPAALPDGWRARLAREAALLATLFQELGYYGRCSLDAILVGAGLDDAELHWIECNGRWGGTSIPMTVVNRLTGDWAKHPFVAVYDAGRVGFDEALRRTDDLLYRPTRAGDAALSGGAAGIGRDGGAARRAGRTARRAGSAAARTGIVFLAPGDPHAGRGVDLLAVGRSVEEAQALAGEAEERLRRGEERLGRVEASG